MAISQLEEYGRKEGDDETRDPFLQQPTTSKITSPRPTNNGVLDSIQISKNDNIDEEHRCGFGPALSPQWLQRFASKKAFIVVFSLLAVIQGMTWAYFTATITTLEKRFKISSRTTGIVMTGNELSQILFSIVLAYYGGRGHRPRWIAAGVLISALSCYVLASPHLFYGPGNDALALTEEYAHNYDSSYAPLSNTSTKGGNNVRNHVQLCNKNAAPKKPMEDCDVSDVSIVPLVLIFLSQFVSGIGVLLFFSLGGPYLDDNMKKTKSPMMFGVTMSLRLVGPTLGFLFAAKCLSIYISPTLTPFVKPEDPRWIGAWWLGWVVLGTMMALTSFLIAMFPRELPRAALRKKLTATMAATEKMTRTGSQLVLTAEAATEAPVPTLRDMPKAVRSLITNKVNIFNNLSGVFYIFSAIGYWSYMPKYMETIFRQTAVKSAVASGIVSILFQSVGLLLSGFIISKFRPSARKLAAWNVFIGFLYVVVKASFTQMGCEQGDMHFGSTELEGSWNLTAACNVDCNCKVNKIFPVCHKEEKIMFYSACHAGCESYENGTISNCACLGPGSLDDTVQLGVCDESCRYMFFIFLAVNAFIKLLDSSGRIGNMLVSYRCVDPSEKSLAIGFSIFLVSIMAMLPSPILFGQIFDSVCLVWGTKCGQKGNCWLYDGERLRYIFNLTAAGFTCIGALFDCLVWYYVKDLDLYDEDVNIKKRAEAESKKKQPG